MSLRLVLIFGLLAVIGMAWSAAFVIWRAAVTAAWTRRCWTAWN
jgi:hypothetical protein